MKVSANVKVRMPDDMVEQLTDAARAAGHSLPEMLRTNLLDELRNASVSDLTIERQPPKARPRVISLRSDFVQAVSEVAAATYATKGEVLYTFAARFLASMGPSTGKSSLRARSDRSLDVSAAA